MFWALFYIFFAILSQKAQATRLPQFFLLDKEGNLHFPREKSNQHRMPIEDIFPWRKLKCPDAISEEVGLMVDRGSYMYTSIQGLQPKQKYFPSFSQKTPENICSEAMALSLHTESIQGPIPVPSCFARKKY